MIVRRAIGVGTRLDPRSIHSVTIAELGPRIQRWSEAGRRAMRPTHTISSRPPTADERAVIERQAKPDAASYGCLAVAFGIMPIVSLAAAGGWLVRRWDPGLVGTGRTIGAIAGAGILARVLFSFVPFERRRRRRAADDAKEMRVQEVEVRDPRVVSLSLIGDNAPILAFDIGLGKLLFLQGQWLVNDDAIYGVPAPQGDAFEEFLNGLPPPHSFPSDAFTVTRLPHSGHVLGIHVTGNYLRPEREVDALRREFQFADSEVFEGELDRIAEVLAREHAARFPDRRTAAP